MGVLLDVTPLRVSPDFRRLWTGQAVSFLGSAMTTAALPFQVYRETRSSLAVGLLGMAQLGPLLVCSVAGGALADSMDKRRLLLGVTTVALVCAAALSANAALDQPRVWLVFVLGAVAAGTMAVTFPVLRSLLPLLLQEPLRPAGFALQATYGSFGMMAGPAIGGVLIATIGLAGTYAVDVGTYALALLTFVRISPAPPIGSPHRASLASVLHGFRFLRGQPLILGVFGIDLVAMVFGMPRALLPALTERLGGGPSLYGFLLASIAAGMFVASLSSGWTGRVRRQGAAILWAVAAWGAAIAVAGLSTSVPVVLLMFAVAGAGDMISGVFRSAMAADVTPDDLRGRISGVEIAVYAGGPQLGDVEAGVVGGLVSVPFAIVSGGLACVAGAGLFAIFFRRFATYTVSR